MRISLYPFSRRNKATSRRKKRSQRRAYAAEVLECRQMLSADPLSGALSLDPDTYDDSTILVRYRTDADAGAGIEYSSPDGLAVTDSGAEFDLVPGMRMYHLGEGVSVEEAMAAFAADSNVLYAEPNYYIQLLGEPDDPQIDSLWGMNNTGQTGGTADADIDAFEAWDISTGTGSTIVAVIDTGVDYTHEDLAANIWVNPGEIAGDGIDNDGNGFIDDIHGWDFANNDANPMDDHNHGTHVAGTIGAIGNNGVGVAGVNWNATIMPVKFISANGSGSIADAVEAIDYAVDNGAKISNNSWGFNGGFSQSLYDAIANAQSAGHIFVAAAGNGDSFGNGLNNDSNPFWPANTNLDNVVAVAALDHNDDLATFSNYGATTVDVGAPGVGILSTTIGDTYSTFNGTSMATPHVTGTLSLIMDQNPGWDYRQVIDRLYETVDSVSALSGKTTTGGRINVAAALGPDVTGPRVLSSDPADYLFDPFNSIRVEFSEAIDPDTFTAADVLSFTGPNGAIAVTGVDVVPGTFTRKFDVKFAQQDELGDYTLVLGPNIADLAGNLMDADRDGNAGESIDDRSTISFSLVPFFADLDFGTNTSPVKSGFQQVLKTTGYTAERGFGWTSGTIDSRDRGAAEGDELTRDFNFSELATFVVDVPDPPAIYTVKVTMGDSRGARDQQGIYLEGILADSVTTAENEYVTKTYQTTVADGQLTITLDDLGGTDPLVVINALEIDAVGDDTTGPKVTATDPTGEAYGSLDGITVSFDEAIDAATFTTADVQLTGPNGSIAATAVNTVSAFQYEVVFAEQTTLGDYTLTIGPDIADVAGNLMNQDGDATAGESTDDQFTAGIELKEIPPFEAHFDFGTAFSPVAAGATRVNYNTTYTAAQGYGWTSGSIDSRDRGSAYGTDLTRDFNFTAVGTFAVDVASQPAVYDVTLTLGDPWAARDQVGVFLEGGQFDTVSTASGEVVSKTYRVTVSDGQLNVKLEDLGGSSTVLMVNGLDVVQIGLDSSGPKVVGTDPDGETSGNFNAIAVTFDETVDESTFTAADVSFAGPSGSIAVAAVNKLSPTKYEIKFANQTTLGDYTLIVGPDIADVSGNLMNQDGDATNGESTDDRFTSTIELVETPAFERHFDFGTFNSPVASGATRINYNTTYNASQGYGWTSGSIDSRDRGAAYGNDLTRDFNFTELGTFAVDVLSAPAAYDVTVTLGDPWALRDDMGIFLEGSQLDSVTAQTGTPVTKTYRVTVSDGQLTLKLDDLGGSNTLVMIDGLDVVRVGPDTSGAKVTETDPADEAGGSMDHITVTFDEAIDETTFTTDDVVELTGPNGAITPNAVNKVTATTYEITFDRQTSLGDYTLTIGPDIFDVVGNPMNQDGDSANGESTDDQFTTTIELVPAPPFSKHFDFGTAFSPVASGATRVNYNTTYSSSQGYGWTSGSIDSRDRGSSYGDDLTRDFNFTELATFAVDVLSGDVSYDVKVTMGDPWALRDNMGVFLEGTQVDSVTAPLGQIAVKTYRVTVTDGQLTLKLDDLGGSNSLVMINGLDIVEVQSGTPSIAGSGAADAGNAAGGNGHGSGPANSGLPMPPIGANLLPHVRETVHAAHDVVQQVSAAIPHGDWQLEPAEGHHRHSFHRWANDWDAGEDGESHAAESLDALFESLALDGDLLAQV